MLGGEPGSNEENDKEVRRTDTAAAVLCALYSVPRLNRNVNVRSVERLLFFVLLVCVFSPRSSSKI